MWHIFHKWVIIGSILGGSIIKVKCKVCGKERWFE